MAKANELVGELNDRLRAIPEFLSHIKHVGFSPATVVDVGVAHGTPALYDAFPDAYLVLVEPLDVFAADVRKILGRRAGESHQLAFGKTRERRRLVLRDDPHYLAAASVLSDQRGGTRAFEIEIAPMDEILDAARLPQPMLVKIDAQETDVDVVRGGLRLLSQAELVILEVSAFGEGRNENRLEQIVPLMASIDHVFYDVVGLLSRPYDGALGQLDVAFAKRNGLLRRYKGWQ